MQVRPVFPVAYWFVKTVSCGPQSLGGVPAINPLTSLSFLFFFFFFFDWPEGLGAQQDPGKRKVEAESEKICKKASLFPHCGAQPCCNPSSISPSLPDFGHACTHA